MVGSCSCCLCGGGCSWGISLKAVHSQSQPSVGGASAAASERGPLIGSDTSAGACCGSSVRAPVAPQVGKSVMAAAGTGGGGADTKGRSRSMVSHEPWSSASKARDWVPSVSRLSAVGARTPRAEVFCCRL